MRHRPAEIAVVILAAGLGTRMKSDRAKVLHEIVRRPMILYVAETAAKIAGENVVLVVGHQAEQVRAVVSGQLPVRYAFQSQQLGTGHAVTCALPVIPSQCRHVVILCGDVPLISPDTIRRLIEDHCERMRAVTVLAMKLDNPHGYGRIVTDAKNSVTAIVEETDATDAQRQIRIVNTGIYCVEKAFLKQALQKIKTDNAQGELYLTDIVAIGHRENKSVGAMVAESPDEFHGINSASDLAFVEGLMQRRRCI